MCLTPRIIVNPQYIKSTHEYPLVHLGTREFVYEYKWPYEFDFRRFHYRRNGVTIKNLENYYAYNLLGDTIPVYMTVPCGRCAECVSQKESQIVRRCYLEDASSKHRTLFLTLTYDDAHLPPDGVRVDDVQRFFKRLRSAFSRKLGYYQPLRYCLFSEYGKLRGRPHYHALLFNIDTSIFPKYIDFVKFIEDRWYSGFIYIKHLENSKGIAYTTKYLLKGTNVPHGKNPNFWLASRSGGGLGSPILNDPDFILQALSNPEFKVTLKVSGDVKTFHLPKFIYDKLVPKATSFYPPAIVSAVRSLCYDLVLLHSCDKFEAWDEYTFKYPYVFPPHLMEKYGLVFNHYMRCHHFCDGYLSAHCLETVDVPALCLKIDELVKKLESFVLDIDRVLESIAVREMTMRPYIKHCLEYISTLPSESDRETLLVKECQRIDNRTKDFQ